MSNHSNQSIQSSEAYEGKESGDTPIDTEALET